MRQKNIILNFFLVKIFFKIANYFGKRKVNKERVDKMKGINDKRLEGVIWERIMSIFKLFAIEILITKLKGNLKKEETGWL